MKQHNKLWALFIALIALVALCVFAASAETITGTCGANGDNLTWSYDTESKELTISGTGEMANFSSNGSPWYAYQSEIEALVINPGVTSIGTSAFQMCISLNNLVIPSSVEEVGMAAVNCCLSLTNLTLSEGLKTIGVAAFGVSFVEDIVVPNSVECIDEVAFGGSPYLKSVHLGTNIQSIGYAAFNYYAGEFDGMAIDNSNFETIYTCMTDEEWAAVEKNADLNNLDRNFFPYSPYIADGVKVVTNAHQWNSPDGVCTLCGRNLPPVSGICGADGNNLTWTLDDQGVLTISGEGAMENYYGGDQPWFDFADSITSVVVNDGVTSIGSFAFFRCFSLESASLPEGLTRIEFGAFAATHLQNIIIPNNVTFIGTMAFAGNPYLRTVRIGTGVRTIGYAAFNGDDTQPSFSNANLAYIRTCLSEEDWDLLVAKNVVSDENAEFLVSQLPNADYKPAATEVVLNAHVPGDGERENEQAATCTSPASYEVVAPCFYCGETVRETVTTGTALGHAFSLTWTWSDDNTLVTVEGGCSRCDAAISQRADLAREEQDDGSIKCTASVTYDGETYTNIKVISASGTPEPCDHQVTAVSWAWTTDGSAATAIGICTLCNQPVSAVANVQTVTNADGSKTCTATVTLGGQTFEATKIVSASGDSTPHTSKGRCSMCNFYEEYKNVPFVGWIVSIVHFFVHMSSRIGK